LNEYISENQLEIVIVDCPHIKGKCLDSRFSRIYNSSLIKFKFFRNKVKKSMKKWIAGLLIAILLSTFAVSCAPKPKEPKAPAGGTTGTTGAGDKTGDQGKTDAEGIPEGGI